MKRFIIITVLLFCFSSCYLIKGWIKGRKYVSVDNVKKEITYETYNSTLNKDSKKVVEKFEKETAKISTIQEKDLDILEELEKKLDQSNFTDQNKKSLKEKISRIRGKTNNDKNDLVQMRLKIKNITEFLKTDNIKKITDSLVSLETLRLKSRKDSSIKEKEAIIIRQKITNKLAEIINSKVQEGLFLSDEYNTILINQNTIMYETKQCLENLSLNKYILVINNESNFDLGSEFLTEEGKKIIINYANIYYDSLYSRLNGITSLLNDSNSKFIITLNVTCDGYSDTKKFTEKGVKYFSKFLDEELSMNDKKQREQLNQVLSQRRADEIMKTFVDVYKKKKIEEKDSNKYKFEIKPESTGHGEELPKRKNEIIYETDGEDDIDRRVNFLECIFTIEKIK